MLDRLEAPKSVTKSDTDFNNARMPDGTNAEYLYVGTAGDVAVVDCAGGSYIYKNVAAGGYHHIGAFQGVLSTGTTATDIAVTRRK